MASLIPPSNGTRKFDVHPAGDFSAVLCDVYALEEVNYFCGKAGQDGKIDERATALNLYLCFLTESMIEINGEMKPRWIRQKFSFSLGKNAKLTAALKGWIAELAAHENLYNIYGERGTKLIDTLIGTPAYITITHSPNLKDPKSPYVNVTKILKLPKFNPEDGSPVAAVTIPAEYKRSDVDKLQGNANARIQEKNLSWAPAAKATAVFRQKQSGEGYKSPEAPALDDDDLPF
jgi:hypothetical protein